MNKTDMIKRLKNAAEIAQNVGRNYIWLNLRACTFDLLFDLIDRGIITPDKGEPQRPKNGNGDYWMEEADAIIIWNGITIYIRKGI